MGHQDHLVTEVHQVDIFVNCTTKSGGKNITRFTKKQKQNFQIIKFRFERPTRNNRLARRKRSSWNSWLSRTKRTYRTSRISRPKRTTWIVERWKTRKRRTTGTTRSPWFSGTTRSRRRSK